jgi:hypothetical protein
MVKLFPFHENETIFDRLEVFESFRYRDNVYLKTSRHAAMSHTSIRTFKGNESVQVVN